MILVAFGALLVVCGVVVAAMRTASRGKLSEPHGGAKGTLEPRGRGDRLSLKADLPGIALVIAGGLLIFAGAAA
jgi:hypothetical protein